MTRNRGGSGRIWIERLLLLIGIAGLGIWMGTTVVSWGWQAWENQAFDLGLRAPEIRAESAPVSLPQAAEEGSIVGRLTIPRLQLSSMVREGVGEETLSLALGHIPSTAMPGEDGNVAIAGHRDTIFRSLRGIRKNDLIRLETPSSGSYVYEVSLTEIVDPSEVSVLKASGESELTLVTCYPFYYIGSAPKRFIVKAREVDRGPETSGQAVSFR